MLVDKTKDEKENILDHINASLSPQDKKILKTEIDFGVPRVIPGIGLDTVKHSDPNSEYIYNTQVEVKDKHNHHTTVEYRRLDLGLQLELLGIEKDRIFRKKYQEYSQTELKKIYCELGQFREESIEMVVEDTGDIDTKKMRFYPIEDSLLYIGEIVSTCVFDKEKKHLKDLFRDPSMDGLEYHVLP